MKTIVDKLEDVAEALRGEFKQGADGRFYAQLEGLEEGSGHPAIGELLRAKQREATAHTEAKAQLAAIKTELDKAKKDLHDRLKGKVDKSDLEALEASYRQQIVDAETAGKAAEARLTASLRDVLVDSAARKLAAKLAVDADAADLLAESIQRRLAVEITADGKAVTRVLDAEGKLSALSFDGLEKEIVGTKKYAGLLLGSKASGGGASSSSGASGASPGKIDWLRGKPEDLAKAAAKINPLLGG